MLELAAKAAGHVVDAEISTEEWLVIDPDENGDQTYWNPLTDDGDALRLAVKLKMSLDLFDDYIAAGYTPNDNECLQIEEPHENEPMQATRRAITRAAAEIGKALG